MRLRIGCMAGCLVIAATAGCGTSAAGSTTTSTTFTTTTTTTPATTTSTAVTTTSEAATTTTTTTAAPAASLAGRVIVIDPGHNGQNYAHPDEINQIVDIGNGTKACNTTGTATADGYAEATLNWELALVTKDRLEALGATVVLTRQDNEGWGPCITERAAIGNDAHADAVVSIHADGAAADGRGFHVIYPATIDGLTDDIAAASLRLAEALRAAFQETGMPISNYTATDGLSRRSDLGGLNLSDVPVVFLEAGNMKNAADVALLLDPAFRDKEADAIAAALVSFLSE
jgi:N-acetylmuramoyl-L-alanine amidase